MSETTARAISEVTLEARVIRADGTVEELGQIAYWSSNPLRRLVARLRGLGRVRWS